MDIDGTLVSNAIDGTPSSRVLQAIQAAQKKVHVSVSTGRPIFIARDIIRLLGIRDPSAINDATQIYDPVHEKVIETFFLSPQAASKTRNYLLNAGIQFMCNTGDSQEWYSGGRLPKKLCGLAVPEYSEETADTLIDALSGIPNTAVHKVKSFKKGLVWVTVTSPIATKLHSVLEITKLLKVTPEETIGVGDGYNDYPLLSACGLKIAMGNAVPELKAIADFIAPSVEDDGVATVIEKFILS